MKYPDITSIICQNFYSKPDQTEVVFYIELRLIQSCNPKQEQPTKAELIEEILKAEKYFCDMTATKGLAVSFPYFAADSAVIKRGEKLIKGKPAISAIYSRYLNDTSVSLTWEPDFVDVSKSGDMAYTYGTYTFTISDSVGNKHANSGIFHTVWKRQPDGQWKYVFD